MSTQGISLTDTNSSWTTLNGEAYDDGEVRIEIDAHGEDGAAIYLNKKAARELALWLLSLNPEETTDAR